jgi:hypothetical protein
MTDQPAPEPHVTPVSFLVEFAGFTVNAVAVDGDRWALQGPAMDLVSQLSQHGGPQAQLYRWDTHEAAEGAAVRLLGAGAAFVQAIAGIDPDRA